MEPVKLSKFGRRVLGHLPVWHENEAWLVEEEGGPEVAIRAYKLSDFTTRLSEDTNLHVVGEENHPPDEKEVLAALEGLRDVGLAEWREGEGWRMTQLGYETLVAPPGDAEGVVPGPVTIELQPATVDIETLMTASHGGSE